MVSRGGQYYLFYSGGEGTWDPTYAVGVARSSSITGPYTKACAHILTQISAWDGAAAYRGPGHCSVVNLPSSGSGSGRWESAIFYHQSNQSNSRSAPRVTFVDQVSWGADGWPTVGWCGAPSEAVQPLPMELPMGLPMGQSVD